MKRRSSGEIERETKRPRVDISQSQEKRREGEATEMEVTDIPATVTSIAPIQTNIDPIIGTTPTFQDLPLEILGNHIFKFFDFEYWLKSFVVVSKYWQLAAVQSTVDKQLRVRKVGIVGIVKQYKVSTLIVKFSPHLPELVTLIKASPRVRSVKLKREVYYLRETAEPSLIAKYSCSNVSTLYISAGQLHLLRFFPNATRVCLSTSHTYYSQNFTSHSVLELALPATSYKPLPERLANIKGRFPALQIIHFLLVDKEEHQSEKEVRAELSATANELGVSLEYSCHFDSNSPIVLDTYDGHFNNFGRTAFIHALAFENGMQKVFQQFPALTLEYEQDFIHRKPQFVFPHMKANRDGPKHLLDINWNNYIEHLPLCFEKNMLPPAGVVSYQLNCLNDYKTAIQIIKLHQGVENTNLLKKATSLVQANIDLGVEIFQKLIDEESVLYERICSEDVKYEDLTPIRDLLTKKVLKYNYKHLLRELSHLNETKWQYLIQIDSWLHPNSRAQTTHEGIGIQYLSDEAQAKHFVHLLMAGSYDKLEADSQTSSKQLNQVFHKGTSLLGYCSNDTTEIVNRFALDVNQPDKNGITPIIHAISRDNKRQLEELLQLGADPNFACNTSLPLHYSLQNNSGFEVVSSLVFFGADVNRKEYDRKGRSVWPITLALAHSKAYQMVKFLLAQGADPMVIDIAGNTLLHILLKKDFCLETAPLIDSLKLLALRIDINKKNIYGDAVLHRAVSGGFNRAIVETLVKCGADVNLPDAKGRTPLLLAIRYGASLDTFKALLATNKVDIKAKTNKGQSFVSLFLQHSKPSAFMKDDEFKTLCQPYLTAENMEFLKNEYKQAKKADHLHNIIASSTILAKFHVDLGYPLAKRSFKLLDSLVVTNPEKSEILDYFLANGVDINAKNSRNETALLSEIRKIPWRKKTVAKIQLLLKHGASFPDKDDLGDVSFTAASFSQGLGEYLLASSPKKKRDANLVELRQKNNANI